MSDISIQVAVPDGLPVPRASLWIEPETTEQFEAYLDALGGITRARVSSYDYLVIDIDGGNAHLQFPNDLAPLAPPPTPQSDFAASLRRRQDAALDFMARLEASGESIEP